MYAAPCASVRAVRSSSLYARAAARTLREQGRAGEAQLDATAAAIATPCAAAYVFPLLLPENDRAGHGRRHVRYGFESNAQMYIVAACLTCRCVRNDGERRCCVSCRPHPPPPSIQSALRRFSTRPSPLDKLGTVWHFSTSLDCKPPSSPLEAPLPYAAIDAQGVPWPRQVGDATPRSGLLDACPLAAQQTGLAIVREHACMRTSERRTRARAYVCLTGV